jgi:hypothetical protein
MDNKITDRKSKILANFINISEPSFFRWKSNKHTKLINLIDQYFTKDDILEFEKNNTITNFELQKELFYNFSEINLIKFSDLLVKNQIKNQHDIFIIFYFRFLAKLKKSVKNKSKIDMIFSETFYDVPISKLFNIFLADSNSAYNSDEIFIICTNYENFLKYFDRWLLFFLKINLNNDLILLHDHNFFNPDIDSRKEIFFQILGFHIFFYFSHLTNVEKLEKLNFYFKKYLKLQSHAKYKDIYIIFNQIGFKIL